jgi:hypothetical protein
MSLGCVRKSTKILLARSNDKHDDDCALVGPLSVGVPLPSATQRHRRPLHRRSARGLVMMMRPDPRRGRPVKLDDCAFVR